MQPLFVHKYKICDLLRGESVLLEYSYSSHDLTKMGRKVNVKIFLQTQSIILFLVFKNY